MWYNTQAAVVLITLTAALTINTNLSERFLSMAIAKDTCAENESQAALKICPHCKQEKPYTLEYFYRNKNEPSGMTNQCQACISDRAKQHYRDNREAKIKAAVAYARANKEAVNKRKAEGKRQQRRAQGIPIRQKGLKTHCPHGHELSEDNLCGGKALASGAKQCRTCRRIAGIKRARAKGVQPYYVRTHCPKGHELTATNIRKGRHSGSCLLCHRLRESRRYSKEAQEYIAIILNDPCSYCGKPSRQIDHIQAISKGGTDDWWNLTGACQSCNARKHARSLLRFVLAVSKHA